MRYRSRSRSRVRRSSSRRRGRTMRAMVPMRQRLGRRR